MTKKFFDFLEEVKIEAEQELAEIKADGDGNSYAAGYERGKIDLIKNIEVSGLLLKEPKKLPDLYD